jgi:hypothetical protein
MKVAADRGAKIREGDVVLVSFGWGIYILENLETSGASPGSPTSRRSR